MMRRLAFCLTCMIAALLPHFAIGASDAENTIQIERGIETFMQVDFPMRRLSIGDTKIIDVSVVDGSQLRILGLAGGRTNFSLWRDGSTTPTTYEVIVSDGISELNTRLSSGNSQSIRLSDVSGKMVLEGQFDSAVAQKDARDLAKFVTGKDVLDLSGVNVQESVQVEAEIIAVSSTALRGLGVNLARLDRSFSFALTAPNTLQSFALNPNGQERLDVNVGSPIADAFNLLLGSPKYNSLAIISALEGSNLAQTLARPTLVVRSGEKAQFLVGGEIPIPVPQGGVTNAITIEYKRFGVSLYVEPTILKDRRIALKIRPEVSELDFSNAIAVQGFAIPAIKTRETETTVEVPENEPFIIAGLMFDSGSTMTEKVPYLGDVPILGRLFKRTRETHEAQELVIVVTPRLVTSATQDQSQRDRLRGGATWSPPRVTDDPRGPAVAGKEGTP
jgi:pilus assembly protein CpaC